MMTSRTFAITFAVAALATLGACEQKASEPKKAPAPAQPTPRRRARIAVCPVYEA
jgi:hypothetical protein